MEKRRQIKGCMCFIFIVLFMVCIICVVHDVADYYEVKQKYGNIRNKVKKDKKIDWSKLHNINPDIVAWIEIPNTKIDYPIMQTKNNVEYLTKDIYGNYSQYGSVFLDERLYGSDLGANPNDIIYGHNMGRWTNVMFGPLKEYLNYSYINGHETVILYTPEKIYRYKIASVEYGTSDSSVYETEFDGIVFSKWVREQTRSSLYQCLREDELNFYIKKITRRNVSENIKKYGNTLTLSTCDTTHSNDKKICIFCIPGD